MRLVHYILLVGVGASSAVMPTMHGTNSAVKQTPADMALMNETIKLLDDGNLNIKLLETHKDLTLLVGLSGSGKSTMAHLLGNKNPTLEAYEINFDILIRDTGVDIQDKKISHGNNTLTSQTLFPELIVDDETGEAMYDCPGFQDTRSSKIEIANGFFIRKLVEHAQSIKILVVVKYDAVKIGGSRIWFTSLVTQLLQFMRNVPTYKGAIALLVTKFDVVANDERALNMIATFIELSQPILENLLPERKEDIVALFGSWLEKDSQGTYVNLDFFRQPEETGMLKDLPKVMANRDRIRQMVFHSASFQHVPCNSQDFGIPLSGDAKAYIQKIQMKLSDQANHDLNNLLAGIQKHADQAEAASNNSLLHPEYFAIIQAANDQLNEFDFNQEEADSKALNVLVTMAKSLGVSNVQETAKSLKESFHYLDYLDNLQPDQKGDKKAIKYSEQLVKIVKEAAYASELKVRTKLGPVLVAAFSKSRDAVERTMKTLDKNGKLQAVNDVAAAIEDCDLNLLDFEKCAQRVLDLNREVHFGLATGETEKVVKLVSLLPREGPLAKKYKTENLLLSLGNQLEKVAVHVGKEAGITAMFPQIGFKCVADE